MSCSPCFQHRHSQELDLLTIKIANNFNEFYLFILSIWKHNLKVVG